MMTLLLDHIWQSTLFAGGAGLLTLLLRRNGPGVRYGLWLAASLKFLLPFALLTALGHLFPVIRTPARAVPDLVLLNPVTRPFSEAAVATSAPHWGVMPLLLALWGAGTAALLIRWMLRWWQLQRVMHTARDQSFDLPVPVKKTRTVMEPGLVGVLKPMILLPEDIESRLSAAELRTALAHEICHLRRRDNLSSALHMLVEALFWFHPLVWWIGRRLNVEREHACDEQVLASGHVPQVYAETILKVCKFHTQSPLACVPGISGADLKKRMEMIMEDRISMRLNAAKKLLLAGCAALAIAAPITVGLLNAPIAIAQAGATTGTPAIPGSEALIRHQIEAWQKHEPDTSQMTPQLIQATETQRLGMQATIDAAGALKSLSFKGVDDNGWDAYGAQFEHDYLIWELGPLQDGKIAGIVLFKPIPREDNKPIPGAAAALRRLLEGALTGQYPLDVMSPGLQAAVKAQEKMTSMNTRALGKLKSLTFQRVSFRGFDVYEAVFEHGRAIWNVGPLVDGKLNAVFTRDVRVDTPH
jgi:beta-lactamase regulating signal transducer with metallopeptidase domain